MNEPERIADQLHRSYFGEPWHGPSLKQALENVTAAMAAAHPIAAGHSIWELAAHLQTWMTEVSQTVRGKDYESLKGERDWPPVHDTSEEAWQALLSKLEQAAVSLVESARALDEKSLQRIDRNSYYDVLHGIAQHNAYHAGQIALLKKLVIE